MYYCTHQIGLARPSSRARPLSLPRASRAMLMQNNQLDSGPLSKYEHPYKGVEYCSCSLSLSLSRLVSLKTEARFKSLYGSPGKLLSLKSASVSIQVASGLLARTSRLCLRLLVGYNCNRSIFGPLRSICRC